MQATAAQPGFQIQRATLGDACAIAQVNYAAWQETYRGLIHDGYLDTVSIEQYRKRWESILRKSKAGDFVLVAKSPDGKVLGYCSAGTLHEKFHHFDSQIHALYLLKDFHGMGLGGRLFNSAVMQLRAQGYKSFCVFVLKQNPTINFYRHYQPDFEDTDTIYIGEEDYDDVVFGWNNFNHFMHG